jgi:hypothetical protein
MEDSPFKCGTNRGAPHQVRDIAMSTLLFMAAGFAVVELRAGLLGWAVGATLAVIASMVAVRACFPNTKTSDLLTMKRMLFPSKVSTVYKGPLARAWTRVCMRLVWIVLLILLLLALVKRATPEPWHFALAAGNNFCGGLLAPFGILAYIKYLSLLAHAGDGDSE